tara:strand:+ start:363 stop:545 length:183 start_codon:yes stop_codon:yes gene_type:complete
MGLYKAKKGLFDLENKYFGVHKLQILKEGKCIDITCPELVPDEVMKCLELKKEKKNKEKK